MWQLIIEIIAFLAKLGPAIGGALSLAKQAVDTKKAIGESMQDLHVDKKAEVVRDNQELARNIVALHTVDASYRAFHGLLNVTVYAVMTWGLCKLVAALIETGQDIEHNIKRGKKKEVTSEG